ncbi:MAG: hypothetical protein QXI70_02775 [Methanothrix sp.]
MVDITDKPPVRRTATASGLIRLRRSTIEAIASGIAEAVARQDELVSLGLARAAEFTWERSADAVVALWEELA